MKNCIMIAATLSLALPVFSAMAASDEPVFHALTKMSPEAVRVLPSITDDQLSSVEGGLHPVKFPPDFTDFSEWRHLIGGGGGIIIIPDCRISPC